MNMHKKTEWKVIECDKNYSINSDGIVLNNKTGLIKKSTIGANGYAVINLGDKQQKYIHRLIAEAFIPNPHNKREINHKDSNRSNNSIGNLEWVTPSENIQHSYDFGNRIPANKGKMGIDSPRLKYTVLQISLDGFLIGVFDGAHEAERKTGVAFQNIHKCLLGRRKRAGGYIWAS